MVPGSVAGLMMPSTGHAITEAVKRQRRGRWNPLSNLTGPTLMRALDNFAGGDLRELAVLCQTIAERDDTIPGVKAKREKSVAHKRREVQMVDKSTEAENHRDALEDFWDNARWTSAWDRSRKGGFSRLVGSMQEAVSYRYAFHHIVWKPSRDGRIRATFEAVPVQFFETRDGYPRFLEQLYAIEGVPMDPREWLVSTGDGLMISCAIGYAAKRGAMMDWLRFSEKFAMPGVLGKTPAGKDTAQGLAMREAVANFGNDWGAVLHGADGSETVELIEANGNPNAMPMPALIEMVNRKFAALYRGADLSTMSSSGQGEGTGASLQGDEADILERDDAAQRSEELQSVERTVIEYYFGRGTEPMAKTVILVPEREDLAMLLNATEKLVAMGARISIGDTAKRLGLSIADEDADDDDVLKSAAGEPVEGALLELESETAANAKTAAAAVDFDELLAAAGELVALARREDTARLQDALRSVLRLEDGELVTALGDLGEHLPDFLDDTREAEAAWERITAAALGEGWEAVEEDAA